jgi:RNA polymerase Rpb2, domain 6
MFHVTSRLAMMPGAAAGGRFAAGQVVAYDPSFFAPIAGGGVTYKTGLLVRTAVAALDQTYEDSLMVTGSLARRTSAEITMMRPVSLGRSANLQSYARVGQEVGPDDAIAVFENVSDSADVAALLGRVGSQFDEAIAELSTNNAAARYRGRVVSVRTYYSVDRALLSPSLQAYLAAAEAEAAGRDEAARGAAPGEVRSFAPERVYRDKVNGEPIDGVLILFFIQTTDVAGPGDKYVTASSALKGIISRVFEDGQEPVDEGGQQIDYVISPLSIVSRMTTDAFLSLWSNSVIHGLKKACLKILDGP